MQVPRDRHVESFEVPTLNQTAGLKPRIRHSPATHRPVNKHDSLNGETEITHCGTAVAALAEANGEKNDAEGIPSRVADQHLR